MTDLAQMTKEEQIEAMWKEHAEDALIAVYVPDAENYSREDALKLALERNEQSAVDFQASALNMENAVGTIRNPAPKKLTFEQAMRDLGY